ncbi:MAG: hypothetical protein IPH91_09695 [Elusimicrobia bacterium]|nr:hypothetical protein [Elusimicrobiota bacterium]
MGRRTFQNNPKDAGFAYWRAVAAFHTVLMGDGGDDALPPAIEAARAALRLNPDARDVHAMLCALYGMRIKNSSIRAVWLGPRLMRHGKQALLAPENPARFIWWPRAVITGGGNTKRPSVC